eukprot:gene23379-24809_t
MTDSSLIARRLSSFRVALLASPDCIARHGSPAAPADLANLPTIVDSNARTRATWTFIHDNERINVAVKPRVEVNSPQVALDAAIAGLGFTRLPQFTSREAVRQGLLVPLLPEYTNHVIGMYAVYPHRRHLSGKVRAFVDFLAGWFERNRDESASCIRQSIGGTANRGAGRCDPRSVPGHPKHPHRPWHIQLGNEYGMIVVRRLLSALLVLICLGGLSGPAVAHPHVWVDARAELVFDKDGQLTAIRHVWRFDDLFSGFATQGLATDDNGVVTPEALKPIAKVNIDSLKDYDYFTILHVGGKRYGFKIPTEYWLQVDNGLLTLFYTLPLVTPVKASGATIVVDIADPYYFVDFTLIESEPALLVDAPTGCSLTVVRKDAPSADAAALLSQIPATERELPPEYQSLTKDLVDRITVKCP